MTITETKVGQRLVCMPALKASCWKMAQHLGAKWPETALYDAKAQEGNSDFQVHRAPSGNLQAICLLPIMPLAYAGAWLRRYEEIHILSSCWKLIIIRLCAVTGMFLARAKKEVKRTKHQICLWKTTRKGWKMMARTRYTYRLVLCRLIVNRHLWTHQNFLRKVFLGFIPIFFSSWFYTAVGHVARYALLSCKETATKTSLGLKSKDGKMRSIYNVGEIKWRENRAEQNSKPLARKYAQNERDNYTWKRTKMACNEVGDTQTDAQGNEKRLKRVAARWAGSGWGDHWHVAVEHAQLQPRWPG